MSAVLEVEKVVKHFGAVRAVDGISFSVEEGEIFGIAGPNGSGKSTLFNIVTGVPFSAQEGIICGFRRSRPRIPIGSRPLIPI